eukprot:3354889-Amphidinium_carterae.1
MGAIQRVCSGHCSKSADAGTLGSGFGAGSSRLERSEALSCTLPSFAKFGPVTPHAASST